MGAKVVPLLFQNKEEGVFPFMQLINGRCHDTEFLASNYFKILIMRLKVNLEQSSIGEGVLTNNPVNLEMQMAFYHETDHKPDMSWCFSNVWPIEMYIILKMIEM